MNITPLFSGSRGNNYLVRTKKQNLLLDAGYGFKALVAKLASLGIAPQDIEGILITHEHTDHTSALATWCKHFPVPVYVPAGAATYVAQHCLCPDVVPVGESFDIGSLHVDCFVCSHDARACVGYRFADGKMSVASVTDTGKATMRLVNFLAPCNTIVLESNHDVEMVRQGNYPPLLKQRILSPLGHLSNEQAAKILQRLADSNIQRVILGHLSQQNNTPQLAYQSAVEALQGMGRNVGKDIFVQVAKQDHNEEI